MTRQIHNALSAALPFQKILMPIQNHNLFDVLLRVARQPRKLRRHPSQVPDHATNHGFALPIPPLPPPPHLTTPRPSPRKFPPPPPPNPTAHSPRLITHIPHIRKQTTKH